MAPAPISQLLGLHADVRAWRLERVRRNTAGEPIMFLRNWVSHTLCPGLPADSLREQGLFRVIERECGVPILLGRRTIDAQEATAEVAERLDVRVGAPVMHVEQTTYTTSDRPLEFSDVWTPPGRLSMSSIVRRRH